MKVIVPVVLNPSNTTTNVPENDAGVWVQPTSAQPGYAKGDKVLVAHHIFQSLIAANKNNPSADVSPATWLDLGADNAWSMFDKGAAQLVPDSTTSAQRKVYRIGTKTTNPNSIAVTVNSGQIINAIALFGLVGYQVTVTMTDPIEGIIYTKTTTLIDPSADGMWEWLFKPIRRKSNIVFIDLPAYGSAKIDVTISSDSGGVVACSMLSMGVINNVGQSCFGTTIGITDYSKKEVDEFGVETILERGYKDRVQYDVRMMTEDVDTNKDLLASLRAVPAVYIGDPNRQATIQFGRYRDLQIVYSSWTISECALDVGSVL